MREPHIDPAWRRQRVARPEARTTAPTNSVVTVVAAALAEGG